MVGFMSQPLCPGEKEPLPPNEQVGGLQNKSGSSGEKEKELSVVLPVVLSLHFPCTFRLRES
jgi:hypothetical protein